MSSVNRYHVTFIHNPHRLILKLKKEKSFKIMGNWTCNIDFYMFYFCMFFNTFERRVNVDCRRWKVTQMICGKTASSYFAYYQTLQLNCSVSMVGINHNFSQFNESKLSALISIHQNIHAIFPRYFLQKREREKRQQQHNIIEPLWKLSYFFSRSLDFKIYIYCTWCI